MQACGFFLFTQVHLRSIDEDIYGYATSRVRNIEDMMSGFKHPIKYSGLPANCFKRLEVGSLILHCI